MWSGTEELSIAWTRMAGEKDAVVGIKDNVTRGNFGKGARIVSEVKTPDHVCGKAAHARSFFNQPHCPISTYAGVSEGRNQDNIKSYSPGPVCSF